MKVFWKVFFLFVAILALAGTARAAADKAPPVPAPAGPSLQLSEMSFDFGELIEGRDYTHDFKIRNTGSATLEIKKVLPG